MIDTLLPSVLTLVVSVADVLAHTVEFYGRTANAELAEPRGAAAKHSALPQWFAQHAHQR